MTGNSQDGCAEQGVGEDGAWWRRPWVGALAVNEVLFKFYLYTVFTYRGFNRVPLGFWVGFPQVVGLEEDGYVCGQNLLGFERSVFRVQLIKK